MHDIGTYGNRQKAPITKLDACVIGLLANGVLRLNELHLTGYIYVQIVLHFMQF